LCGFCGLNGTERDRAWACVRVLEREREREKERAREKI